MHCLKLHKMHDRTSVEDIKPAKVQGHCKNIKIIKDLLVLYDGPLGPTSKDQAQSTLSLSLVHLVQLKNLSKKTNQRCNPPKSPGPLVLYKEFLKWTRSSPPGPPLWSTWSYPQGPSPVHQILKFGPLGPTQESKEEDKMKI